MDGVDELGIVLGIELFAERGEVEVDGVGEGFFVVPNAFEDGVSAQDLSFMAGEGFEEGELALGELEVFSGAGCGVGEAVEDEVADLDAFGFEGGITAGEGAQAGEEFRNSERLDEIVVGTRVEALYFVLCGVFGGEHDDRRVETGFAEAFADFEPGDAGEHDVEDEDVVVLGEGEVEAGFSIVGDVGVVAVLPQDSFEF